MVASMTLAVTDAWPWAAKVFALWGFGASAPTVHVRENKSVMIKRIAGAEKGPEGNLVGYYAA